MTKTKSGHGHGTRGGEMFKFSPVEYTIIGLDTADGPSHPLYDERIKLRVPEELIRNIRTYGVLKPVIFERDGERVIVVDGRQRIRAARIVLERQREAGEDEIMVRGIPQRGDGAHLFALSRAANIHQADDALTQARNAQRLVDLGRGIEDVAVAFGVTEQTVKTWLALLDLAPAVRSAVEREQISPTAAAKLRKFSRDEQVAKLAELTADGAKPTVSAAAGKARAALGKAPIITSKERLRQIAEEILTLVPDESADVATEIAAHKRDTMADVLRKIAELCGVIKTKETT